MDLLGIVGEQLAGVATLFFIDNCGGILLPIDAPD